MEDNSGDGALRDTQPVRFYDIELSQPTYINR